MKRLLTVVASMCMLLGSTTVLAEGPASGSGTSSRKEGLAARAQALLARIQAEGLVSVTLRAQDPVDVGLLRLVSQFDGTLPGTAEARALLALRPVTARPLSILAGGWAAARATQVPPRFPGTGSASTGHSPLTPRH